MNQGTQIMSDNSTERALDIKVDHLVNSRNDALNRHENGTTYLAEAIGHAYELFRLQPFAREPEWLEAEIKIWNDQIVADNKVVEEDKDLSEDEKKEQQRMKAEGRDGTSEFTAMVKLIFKFDKPSHASQVNKYCNALEWAHREFADGKVDLGIHGDIRDRIVAAGGVTRVSELHRKRQIEETSNATSVQDEKEIKKAVIETGRSSLKALPIAATIAKGSAVSHDGLFLLLGRQNGADIEVVEVANAEADDIDRLVRQRRGVNKTDVDEGLELIGRVLDIGKIVKEGKSTITLNSGSSQGGHGTDINRNLTLRATDAGQPELIVSANRTTASIVVRAVSKNGALATPPATVYLKTEDRKEFEKMFSDWQRRRLYDLKFTKSPMTQAGTAAKSPLMTEAISKVLKDENEKPRSTSFYWPELDKLTQKPLDLAASFQSNFSAEVSVLQLEHLFEAFLVEWGNMSQEKKRKDQVLEMRLDGVKLELSSNEAKEVEIDVDTGNTGTFILPFKVSDLYAVFDQLRKQPTETFTFVGDDTGMLKIVWEDELANYDVCLPTVMDGGQLNPKHLDKISA
jgi:hypothetical protein